MTQLNSKGYWDKRFSGGSWEEKGGTRQSREHAKRFLKVLNVPREFSGSICDFGCATGEALPVYRETFPNATLLGMDISDAAIKQAEKKFGSLATFTSGEASDVPEADIIITSHVLEHIEDQDTVINALRKKCRKLFVVVPYDEQPLGPEHVRRYQKDTLNQFEPVSVNVCFSGLVDAWLPWVIKNHFKNYARMMLGRPRRRIPRQVVYEIAGV